MQIKRIGLGLTFLTQDDKPELRLTYNFVGKDKTTEDTSQASAPKHLPDLLAQPTTKYEPGTGTGSLFTEGSMGRSPDEKTLEDAADRGSDATLRAFDVPFDLWASSV